MRNCEHCDSERAECEERPVNPEDQPTDCKYFTSKVRRVCLFGGPGCGKSTTSAYIFSHAKIAGRNIEQVQEFVKDWAYEGRTPTSFDQIFLMAQQLRKEDLLLRSGVDSIVTDSPVLLSACYAFSSGFMSHQPLFQIAMDFEKAYPALNIYLNRRDKKYVRKGRFQSYDDAVKMDEIIRKFLNDSGVVWHEWDYQDRDRLLAFILETI